jgi:hypothetical protein
MHRATHIRVHPRFKRTMGSPYDFALLKVDAWPKMRAAPIAGSRRNALEELPLFAAVTSGSGVFHETPLVLRSVNSLVMELTGPARELCRGSSGAPVIQERAGFFTVVGVLSYGPRSCDGNIVAGRAHVARGDLFSADGSEQTCGQCQAELGAVDNACSTAMQRCAANAACTTLKACVDDCESETCLSGCRTRHAPLGISDLGATGAVMRCLCSQKCSSSCSSLCEIH